MWIANLSTEEDLIGKSVGSLTLGCNEHTKS